jgi:hypothetical protein
LRAWLSTSSRSTSPLPNESADFIETVAMKDALQTNSDVNAPTILTLDATPTSGPAGRAPVTDDRTVYEPAKPQTAQPEMSGATVAESGAMASSVTVPRVSPAPAPEVSKIPAPATAAKSKAWIPIVVGVLLLGIVVVGAGGFWLWSRSRSAKTVATDTNVNRSGETANVPKEVSRYWIELEPAQGSEPTRVAAPVPLASGQSFKLHFTFNEEGYLYIFGPGPKNQPTAFLTTKPLPETGVTSNKVGSGVEFSFPKGTGNNLTLDKKPGTDNFTIIFTKTPLPSPSFLNEPVTGESLSSEQQADLKAFVEKYQKEQPSSELDESNPSAPFMKVKTRSGQPGDPIVFDVRIQHN